MKYIKGGEWVTARRANDILRSSRGYFTPEEAALEDFMLHYHVRPYQVDRWYTGPHFTLACNPTSNTRHVRVYDLRAE